MSFLFQFRASRYITGLNRKSELKVIVVCICYGLLFSITSISIYYGIHSNIWVKSYCGSHLLRESVFNQTSELKLIVVWICSELLFRISSVSIYYGTQSDIRVKMYCHLNLLRASVLNFERFDILRDSIGHPSKKLLWFEFPTSFRFQLRASRYILCRSKASWWIKGDSKVFWW